MHDGGEDSMRRLTSSRNLERNKEANMVEPKAKSDSLAPFAASDQMKAASPSMFNPIRTHSLPQPYLLHPPTHHVGAFYHLSPKAAVDPSHYPQTIVALEEELQRAHKELKELREQLAASETGKTQAWKEFTNIKNLLDQISLVEHFAASDNVEVETTPLPPNWSGDVQEIDRLRSELAAAKNLNSNLASELERAKLEIDETRRRQAALENSRMELTRLQSEHGNIYLELDNAKRDISMLQANLSEAWSHHSEKTLELARAKEDIAWLDADARSLAAELKHAKEDIYMLHEDLEVSSVEVSRLRSQYESASSEVLERNHALQAELEIREDEICRLQDELRHLQERDSQISTLQSKLEVLKGQYDTSSSSLSEATQQIEKLRGELESLSRLRSQYESASSEVLKRNHALEAELEVREDEIHRLQGEVTESASALEDRESQICTLQSKLELLKGQYDTSNSSLSEATWQIEKLRGELEPLSRLRSQYESTSSEVLKRNHALQTELEVREDEIRRLQGELTHSVGALQDKESQISTLQSKLEGLKGHYDTSSTSLSEATRQIEKLRGELEPLSRLRSQYESASSEVLKRNHALEAELEVREDGIRRLQVELVTSGRNAASALQDKESQISTLQSKLEVLKDQYDTSNSSLSEATRKTEKLRGDLEILRVNYERCSSELFHAKNRFELEHESIMTDIRTENLKLQEEVASLKAENLVLSASLASARDENINHEAASIARLQSELSAAQAQHEDELEALKDAFTHVHELVMAEIINAREEVINLQFVATEELQHVLSVVRNLKVEMGEVQGDLTTLMLENSHLERETKDLKATTSDARLQEAMSELVKAREAEQTVKTKYRELTTSSQAEIESLKLHMYELRDSEAKAKEALVSISSELQKKKVEFEVAKEALEWVGGDAAALSAEVEALRTEMTSIEALRAEITCTKEGEAKAKAAFTEYSLKLQKMRLDLEDATKLADKARTFKMDLDEVTAKLDRAVESERAMAASVASLKAEVNNARTEMAEKEHQYELELSQMRAQWEVAVISEATLTDANFALNESLLKVMAEAEEAAFAREQATTEAEKARLDVEQAEARIETLEAKMETLQFEVEAAKATEDWAFAQMRLKSIPEYDMETEEGGEIPVSLEEFQSLKARAKELQELVDKRAAVGMAQVNAARASEREMQGRVETLQRELRSCRTELTEAIAKREEAEAAKFSCEAALRAKRGERKSLSLSGTLNGGHPMGKFMNVGDRQGSLNSICFEDSQSSSPSRSSKSFASFASPGRSERSPMEQVVNNARATGESKQRKLKFSSKIGAYFSKRKDSSLW